MPIPGPAEIAALASFPDLPPNHQQAFARALADAIFEALSGFAAGSQINPGIPTSAVPPVEVGVTAAPSTLLAARLPPAQRKATVARYTQPLGLDPAQKQTLDALLAEGLCQGFDAFSGAMMPAGVPVAGGVTTAPGRLQAPAVGGLRALLPAALQRLDPRAWVPPAPVPGRPGQLGPCLPKKPSQAIGRLLADALALFAERVSVAPGIPAAGGVTAGPGRLV